MQFLKTTGAAILLSASLLFAALAQDAHTPGPSQGYQPAPARKSLLPGASSNEAATVHSDQPDPSTLPPRDDEDGKLNSGGASASSPPTR